MARITTTEASRKASQQRGADRETRRTEPVRIGKRVLDQVRDDGAFTDWWLRMHRGRRPLVAERLRFVEWAKDGQASQRFIWEVCRWPSGDSARWMFVCWLLDEVGMWWKVFPSKRAALAYFRQAPAVVIARKSSGPADGVEMRAS